MSISSIQLDAFIAFAKILNFSKAAKNLHITQSALSQRIKNLEDNLGVTLIIRDPSATRITEVGEKLLRYCQTKNALEQDLLSEIKPNKKGELGGIIRIAAFSSVLRSVIIPSLSPLLRKNPRIQCDFINKEMTELPNFLQHAEADFIITDYKLDKPNIEEHILGYEEYVVIESKKFETPNDIFLDNSKEDKATEDFFRHQNIKNIPYKRLFMGETYGILSGVTEGLGRAVMPMHLLKDEKKNIKIVKGYKRYKRPVTLHYHSQSFYPKLYQMIIQTMIDNCSKILSA
jgi:DNA-binding transcriptional LysR family regulator